MPPAYRCHGSPTTMASVTVSANLIDLESHLGDGPLYMPVGGLITLIKLTEVRRPTHYGWDQSLNRGITTG